MIKNVGKETSYWFNNDKLFSLYPVLFGIVVVLINVIIGFHQLHNDFWDNYFIARHLDLNDNQTWFNPQYPILNYLFLRLISGNGYPVPAAVISNILFGMVLLLAAGKFYQKMMSAGFAITSVIALSLYPVCFHYFNVGGGDPASVTLFSLGLAVLITSIVKTTEPKWYFALLAGVCMGAGALFRYHVFVGSAIALFSALLVYRRQWKIILIASVGVGIGYCPQWITNVITGHKLFETQFGPMNVYDLMYKLSWYHTVSSDMPGNVLQIIAQNPLLFVKKYLLALLSFCEYYFPPILAFLIVKDTVKRKISLLIALWTIIYFGLFSATTSGRQGLIVLPFTILCWGFIIESIWYKLPAKITGISKVKFTTIIALIVISFFSFQNMKKIAFRYVLETRYNKIDNYLRDAGCSNVKEVFSTDFDLYFKNMPFFITHFNGGAPRWGTYKYNEEYPEFNVNSQSTFYNDCKMRGVKFLILNTNCDKLAPFLGEFYSGKVVVNDNFQYMETIGKLKIFAVK